MHTYNIKVKIQYKSTQNIISATVYTNTKAKNENKALLRWTREKTHNSLRTKT